MSKSQGPPPDSLIVTSEGRQYWENVASDANGMLGGVLDVMPSASRVDLQGSRTFLARLGIGIKQGRKKVPRALEGGAGIGRITEGLLLHIAERVDLIEPIAKFTAVINGKPGVGDIFNMGLEDWRPVEGVLYDLIWTQWCVGHLTDVLLVQYLERCKAALNPDGGVIVLKENVSTCGEDQFDELDNSVTREDDKFRALFKQAGLKIIRTDVQHGFPLVKDLQLLPWRMYALKPASDVTD
ncbi:alpha-N-methyltransferase NTM1 [Mariannaea sp. PMI_226]|nr:alpha-N-methyltransferase NTM1 [Mariannaea sp. PMI_226]